MRKIFFVLFLILASVSVYAKEPENLFAIKQKLIQYHQSGQYEKDIAQVVDQAKSYLHARLEQNHFNKKKPAIVFDIDETALSNYDNISNLDFGGTSNDILKSENQGNDPVITPTFQLYQYAKAHHVTIFFITGRDESERDVTVTNLKNVGYDGWKKLILRDGPYRHVPAAQYKTAMRKKITEAGYDIILNIGDQHSDLAGGYADQTFKLPNPYYFIP
ncbi:MAG: hypothetical protein A3F12_03835 [Gammaproteobacteria bacterium RIFCSPHIGHO2_12_FULL_38_14]|nr:MAG: hypothetical protein A3F12_03835 [Gammaproteobacteria bacterium RIFCSPHIGHO2_12_FULL_38_14]